METQKRKYFSQNEANQALVLVEKIAKDVVDKWQQILKGEDRVRKQNLKSVQVKTQYKDLSETNLLIEDIQYHTMELAKLGCFFKDFNNGVVLFPAENSGEKGYFMWKYGEQEVSNFYVPQKHYV